VGAFLLKELLFTTTATIYTLVRCAADELPMARLQKVLSDLVIWDTLQPGHKNRIVALQGDLETDFFGLLSGDYGKLVQTIG
jgi:thioester reductase-like protein